MAIIPAGVKVADSSLGVAYRDRKGNVFFMIPRSMQEIIESRVTNGRGYMNPEDLKSRLNIPYAENPFKNNITPEIFCYRRMELPKFIGWNEDLRNGHPSYEKLIHTIISLP
ncbi:MAG: hypothetical protein ABIJ14_02840 [Nanoarchaeota archaeon]|nr:hypothetical protein [Nanoarchaeota archaeon]